tara:strand:+ start:165 stop:437 length:273 start_codon:yes stop_codon:yes gene_type:complete
MTKSELAISLAENFKLSLKEADNIINIFTEEIIFALLRGDRVELRGFGSFSVRNRKAREGRNPKTGEAIKISNKNLPYYRMGKELFKRLN